MSLTEIKEAVEELSETEVTELTAFLLDLDNQIWDEQLDRDFAEGGRLDQVMEKVRSNIRAGRFGKMP